MGKYEALFEDEDNIFGGSPKSKFWDILSQASDDLVKDQFDIFMEKFAAMETMLINEHGEEAIEELVNKFIFENGAQVEHYKKNAYVELTGEIVCRLDS
jgi:hypothetical protein